MLKSNFLRDRCLLRTAHSVCCDSSTYTREIGSTKNFSKSEFLKNASYKLDSQTVFMYSLQPTYWGALSVTCVRVSSDGKYLVVDNETGQLVHLGDKITDNWIPDGAIDDPL